jgi:hypothetical protein
LVLAVLEVGQTLALEVLDLIQFSLLSQVLVVVVAAQ